MSLAASDPPTAAVVVAVDVDVWAAVVGAVDGSVASVVVPASEVVAADEFAADELAEVDVEASFRPGSAAGRVTQNTSSPASTSASTPTTAHSAPPRRRRPRSGFGGAAGGGGVRAATGSAAGSTCAATSVRVGWSHVLVGAFGGAPPAAARAAEPTPPDAWPSWLAVGSPGNSSVRGRLREAPSSVRASSTVVVSPSRPAASLASSS